MKADKNMKMLTATIDDLHDKIQFIKFDMKTNNSDKNVLLNVSSMNNDIY